MEQEVKKPVKIYMGICSTGDRVDAQNYFLRRMEKQYAGRIEFVYPEIFVSRIFHDYARNQYIKQFMETDCDMIWFLDSDIVPCERVLELVAEHGDKWDLAGAPYPVWMHQSGYEGHQVTYCVYRRPDKDKGMVPADIPETGIDFVDGIATGCIFIKRKVIESMTEPYFKFSFKEETREMTEGEDLYFCKKASDLGFQFFIDFSMRCHHFKKISLLEVSNLLTDKINDTIDACDRQIRQIIAKKKLEQMNKPAPAPKSRLILPGR
ncbi:MAG: hypothetical protein NVS1B10_06740 [Candidatus Saccharimonadales bacterium]